MQLKLTFKHKDAETFRLSVNYQHQVQSFIYHALDETLARFLHDRGYAYEKRSFKNFVFSRIFGDFHVEKGFITYDGEAALFLASSDETVLSSMVQNIFFKSNEFRLGKEYFQITGVSKVDSCVEKDAISVSFLSPVTMHSTELKQGRKYTHYYHPKDGDFSRLLTENLKKKYEALFHTAPPEGDLIFSNHRDIPLKVTTYKGFIIKGYVGNMNIQGPPALLQLGLDVGFGTRNAQGYGFAKLL